MTWFAELRALAELKKQRLALERIASVLEALLLNQDAGPERRVTGLRSFYTDKSAKEGEVAAPTDEEFAQWEAEAAERIANGGPEDGGEEE